MTGALATGAQDLFVGREGMGPLVGAGGCWKAETETQQKRNASSQVGGWVGEGQRLAQGRPFRAAALASQWGHRARRLMRRGRWGGRCTPWRCTACTWGQTCSNGVGSRVLRVSRVVPLAPVHPTP